MKTLTVSQVSQMLGVKPQYLRFAHRYTELFPVPIHKRHQTDQVRWDEGKILWWINRVGDQAGEYLKAGFAEHTANQKKKAAKAQPFWCYSCQKWHPGEMKADNGRRQAICLEKKALIDRKREAATLANNRSIKIWRFA